MYISPFSKCILIVLLATTTGCGHPVSSVGPVIYTSNPIYDELADMTPADTTPAKIVNRAKQEVKRRVIYDASYARMEYPGGDVKADRGACTDVLIRSLRSVGYDLQKLIHQDMLAHRSRYVSLSGSKRPDKNIDHRRVPNHKAYLAYHATILTTSTARDASENWLPGDLVYWKLDNGLDHCGIVSNIKGSSGAPMVIHNLSQTTQEDVLKSWKIVAHYRFPKEPRLGKQ